MRSLASNGVIYRRGVEDLPFADRWLVSPTAMMLILTTVRSMTTVAIQGMSQVINEMIDQIGCTGYAVLSGAIMFYPDSSTKDCIRVYKTQADDISTKVSNDGWKLIGRRDTCEILYAYGIDTNSNVVKVLLVKSSPELPEDDEELVDIIFSANDEV